jgi:hypothetical protein
MGYNHSPRIITDGLVLVLDAANSKSYSGSGTTWNDLSGNGYVGTLTNGPTFSSDNLGSIVLDGVDDYVSVSSPQNLNAGLNSFTVEAWVYQKDTGANGIIEARGTGLHGFLWLLNYQVPGRVLFPMNTTTDTGQNFYVSTVNTFDDVDKWMHVMTVVNRGNETLTFYKNGVQQGNSVNITSIGTIDPGSGYRYWIGADLGGPEANINVSIVRHYNRVLTQDEITQNYNAIKSRYGL